MKEEKNKWHKRTHVWQSQRLNPKLFINKNEFIEHSSDNKIAQSYITYSQCNDKFVDCAHSVQFRGYLELYAQQSIFIPYTVRGIQIYT